MRVVGSAPYNVDVSPQQRHAGDDQAILAARHELYLQARHWALNPERDAVVRMAASAQHTQKKAA
jgi:putative transposase